MALKPASFAALAAPQTPPIRPEKVSAPADTYREDTPALSALHSISNDLQYEEARNIIWAAKAAGLDKDDVGSWNYSLEYQDSGTFFESVWNSYKEGSGITASTLFHFARESGWSELPADDDKRALVEFSRFPQADDPRWQESPYFQRKGLATPENISRGRDFAVVPFWGCDGKLQTFQYLPDDAQAGKKFAKGLRKGTSLYYAGAVFGSGWPDISQDLEDIEPHQTLAVAEGVATALSIHEQAGCIGFAAGSVGQFKPVALALRRRFPRNPIIVCADIGEEVRAIAAARAVGGRVAVPPGDRKGFDFDDLRQERGLEAVRQALEAAEYPLPAAEEKPKIDLNAADIRFMLNEEPAPKDILAGSFERSKAALLIAAGGTGKSQLLVQLGVALATNTPWIGHEVDPFGRCHRVLYIACEDGRDDLHPRVRLAAERAGLQNPASRELLADHFKVVSLVGKAAYFAELRGNALQRSAFVDSVIDAAGDFGAEMIAFDPMARLHNGNENDQSHMTALVSIFEEIAQTCNAAVVVAHHVGKAAVMNGTRNAGAARGASAIVDGFRAVFQLSGADEKEASQLGIPKDERKRCLALGLVKANHLPPRDPTYLRREEGGFLSRMAARPGSSSTDLDRIVALISQLAAEGQQLSRRGFVATYAGKDGELGLADKRCRELIATGIETGRLTLEGSLLVAA